MTQKYITEDRIVQLLTLLSVTPDFNTIGCFPLDNTNASTNSMISSGGKSRVCITVQCVLCITEIANITSSVAKPTSKHFNTKTNTS